MDQRSSENATTLPGRYYCAADVFERETEQIFREQWLCVATASRIPETGDWVRVELEGDSILVIRGDDGRIQAFHNMCRHRGTRLCAEAGGHFKKFVVCPYHAWAYGLDGSLARAPHMEGVECFNQEELGLVEIPTTLWEGQVFVNLGENPSPFETLLPALINKFTRWDLPHLSSVHNTTYEIEANWKLVIQNYSECYHCPALHPQLNRLTPFRDSSNDLTEGNVLGGPMHLSKNAHSMTMSGQTCGLPLGDLAGEELRDVHYYVLFPNMFLSLMPDYALVHRIHRLGVTRTRIECEWLFRTEAVQATGFNPSDAIEFWDVTNRQDWEVSEESQKGIGSRAYRPGPYSNFESMIAELDRTYLAQLAESTGEAQNDC